MRMFGRIMTGLLVVNVFSAGAMNHWFGGRGRKKPKKVVVTQEFAMADMIEVADKLTTKAGLCPIEIEDERCYDRSIYSVGATIYEKSEWAADYLKNFTQIMQDFSTFNKERKENELLKTISVSFLKQTINFITTKENGALENDPACVDEFFKAVKKLLSYYRPNFKLYVKKMGAKRLHNVDCGYQSVHFGNLLGTPIAIVQYEFGSEEYIINEHYDKSEKEHQKFKKLLAQESKNWKKQKK